MRLDATAFIHRDRSECVGVEFMQAVIVADRDTVAHISLIADYVSVVSPAGALALELSSDREWRQNQRAAVRRVGGLPTPFQRARGLTEPCREKQASPPLPQRKLGAVGLEVE